MFDPMTAPIGEVLGHPTEHVNTRRAVAVRKVRVDWNDRYNWAAYFAYSLITQNYPYTVANGIPTNTSIVGIGIEPEDAKITRGPLQSSQAVYSKAIITLEYQSVGYNNNGALLVESLEPLLSMKPMLPDDYCDATGKPYPDGWAPVAYDGGWALTIHYPKLTFAPNTANMVRHTNSDAFVPRMFQGLYFPQNTMLYVGGHVTGTLSYDASARYDVMHRILLQGFDWNMEIDPASGEPEYIYLADGGQLYKYPAIVYSGRV